VEVEFGGGLGGGHGGGDNGGGAAEVEFILVRAASLVIHIIQHTSRLQQPSIYMWVYAPQACDSWSAAAS
jgi:hypothetical protein